MPTLNDYIGPLTLPNGNGVELWEYLIGDVRDVLQTLPDRKYQTVVTSPPYWGLRDYGIPPVVWDGDKDCGHEFSLSIPPRRERHETDVVNKNNKQATNTGANIELSNTLFCRKCGAWLGQLGLEPTPELYIKHLVDIFCIIREKLRDGGTIWLNIGDSYASQPAGNKTPSGFSQTRPSRKKHGLGPETVDLPRKNLNNYKPKDLIGIPWMLAFALRNNGWYLRSDIIWHKPNPMPESVNGWRWERHKIRIKPSTRAKPESSHSKSQNNINTPQGARDGINFANHSNEYKDCPGCKKCSPNDGYILRKGSWRPTKSHEYLFMLSKSDKYFGDANAAAEPQIEYERKRRLREKKQGLDTVYNIRSDGKTGQQPQGGHGAVKTAKKRGELAVKGTRNKRSVWDADELMTFDQWCNIMGIEPPNEIKDVWRITTNPYKGAHFATFPPDLIEPCILASTSPKACPHCGYPWARVIEKKKTKFMSTSAIAGRTPNEINSTGKHHHGGSLGNKNLESGPTMNTKTIRWKPTCECKNNDGSGRCHVLDPFGGSGTVAIVAMKHNRCATLIDINPDYRTLALERIKKEMIKK